MREQCVPGGPPRPPRVAVADHEGVASPGLNARRRIFKRLVQPRVQQL